MILKVHKHSLRFLKPAATSKGAYQTRELWLLELRTENGPCYRAECAPLPYLSIDNTTLLEETLQDTDRLRAELLSRSYDYRQTLPSLQFALECLSLQLNTGAEGLLFRNSFTEGNAGIRINGLVWMADRASMYEAACAKAEAGFRCVKLKVGALDFDEECRLLEDLRRRYSPFKLELRVDANGAWNADDAFEKLRDLSRFSLHSIEQPVAAGADELMAEVCAKSQVPVALDESLIGLDPERDATRILKEIRPAFLVFKPTLIGGFSVADAWIREARKYHTGWWATSALESNIGLSAIAQWCGNHDNPLHQGLGTGALFEENFPSPLMLKGEEMWMESLS
ncbi:MAG: o-succinylbenzoate synthase [Bacteroidetes bacterium]|nr:o-succinylbenzoate synthase [Bacteroidota bacterium]